MASRPSVRFRGLTKLTTSEIGTQFTHKVEVKISQLPNTDNTPNCSPVRRYRITIIKTRDEDPSRDSIIAPGNDASIRTTVKDSTLSHAPGLLRAKSQRASQCELDLLDVPRGLHDPADCVLALSKQEVPNLMSHYGAENHCAPHGRDVSQVVQHRMRKR